MRKIETKKKPKSLETKGKIRILKNTHHKWMQFSVFLQLIQVTLLVFIAGKIFGYFSF